MVSLFQGKSDSQGILQASGLFFVSLYLPWQESTAADILSAPSSTGCSYITSTDSLWSMSHVSRKSMASSGPSSRRLWTSTWTVAIRSVGLQEVAVLSVERKGC